jgi:YidC/Oxa1 family membrane protein insertase
MNENRNLLLAVVLSIGIVMGFQYFVVIPREQARRAAVAALPQTSQDKSGSAQTSPALATPATVVAPILDAQPAGEVVIDSPRLTGRINLRGARFDRLTLRDYRQQAGDMAPPVELLNDQVGRDGFVLQLGWQNVAGAAGAAPLALPDVNTVWQADRPTLTPDNPVTLRWNNGQGQEFVQQIQIDKQFMLQFNQSITNSAPAAVALAPVAEILRQQGGGKSNPAFGQEGLVGSFDDSVARTGYRKLDIGETRGLAGKVDWAALTDVYWLVALAPADQGLYQAALSREPDTQANFYENAKGEGQFGAPMQHYRLRLTGMPSTVAPGQSLAVAYQALTGAKEIPLLESYARQHNLPRLEQAVDFGWFYFIAKPLYHLLKAIHVLLGNYGLAIIGLTLMMRIAMFPLANASFKAMKRMKDLQPEMTRVRELYGADKMRMNQEILAMYKRERVNPVGGCLPMLLQLPIFFALYKVLVVAIELRHAPFFGWVHDLSAPDPTNLFTLFGALPWNPPSILVMGILPLLMGGTMVLQQRLNPPPTDPTQAMVFKLMPYMFTLMMAHFAAGLILYWTSNNLLSILQQYWLNARLAKRDAAKALIQSKQQQKNARRAQKLNSPKNPS